MAERRGEWRARFRLADAEVESAFLRACKYIALVPRRYSRTTMDHLHAKCFWELFSQPLASLSTSTSRHLPTRRAIAVSLDRQIFYLPPTVASPKPLSPPLPQKAYDSQSSSVRGSQANAILIPSDNEFDDLDS